MSATPAPDWVFMSGRLVEADRAHVGIADLGLLYGQGFFETFRTRLGRPHGWARNRARLERACRTAGLNLGPDSLALGDGGERLGEAVAVLLEARGLSEAMVRYTVTAGAVGGTPVEWLAARPLPREAPGEGVSLRLLATRRDNGEWLPRPKSLAYINAWAGVRELRERGADEHDEGLFLAREGGWVVETPRRSIAWIRGGSLHYPDPAVGAVEGTCLAWALGLGLPAVPRRAPLEELLEAEAILVLNAVRGVTPVRDVWDQGDCRRLWRAPSARSALADRLVETWKAQWTSAGPA